MPEIKKSVKSYELTSLSHAQKKQTMQANLEGTQCKNVKQCSQQYSEHDSKHLVKLTYTCLQGLTWHKIEREKEQAHDEGLKVRLQL